MWEEVAKGTDWLDKISEAWPIVLSLSGAAAYFIGTKVRASVNDAGLMAITKAVENIEKIIEELVTQKTRNQDHVAALVEKINDACRDIRELRGLIGENSGRIENLRGRMQGQEGRSDRRDREERGGK